MKRGRELNLQRHIPNEILQVILLHKCLAPGIVMQVCRRFRSIIKYALDQKMVKFPLQTPPRFMMPHVPLGLSANQGAAADIAFRGTPHAACGLGATVGGAQGTETHAASAAGTGHHNIALADSSEAADTRTFVPMKTPAYLRIALFCKWGINIKWKYIMQSIIRRGDVQEFHNLCFIIDPVITMQSICPRGFVSTSATCDAYTLAGMSGNMEMISVVMAWRLSQNCLVAAHDRISYQNRIALVEPFLLGAIHADRDNVLVHLMRPLARYLFSNVSSEKRHKYMVLLIDQAMDSRANKCIETIVRLSGRSESAESTLNCIFLSAILFRNDAWALRFKSQAVGHIVLTDKWKLSDRANMVCKIIQNLKYATVLEIVNTIEAAGARFWTILEPREYIFAALQSKNHCTLQLALNKCDKTWIDSRAARDMLRKCIEMHCPTSMISFLFAEFHSHYAAIPLMARQALLCDSMIMAHNKYFRIHDTPAYIIGFKAILTEMTRRGWPWPDLSRELMCEPLLLRWALESGMPLNMDVINSLLQLVKTRNEYPCADLDQCSCITQRCRAAAAACEIPERYVEECLGLCMKHIQSVKCRHCNLTNEVGQSPRASCEMHESHLNAPCYPCSEPCIPLSKSFLTYVLHPESEGYKTTVEENKNLLAFIHDSHVFWEQYKGKRAHQGYYETMLQKLDVCRHHVSCGRKKYQRRLKAGPTPRWQQLRAQQKANKG